MEKLWWNVDQQTPTGFSLIAAMPAPVTLAKMLHIRFQFCQM
jgi:hypothetical protein